LCGFEMMSPVRLYYSRSGCCSRPDESEPFSDRRRGTRCNNTRRTRSRRFRRTHVPSASGTATACLSKWGRVELLLGCQVRGGLSRRLTRCVRRQASGSVHWQYPEVDGQGSEVVTDLILCPVPCIPMAPKHSQHPAD
jgi:hypothetical protein